MITFLSSFLQPNFSLPLLLSNMIQIVSLNKIKNVYRYIQKNQLYLLFYLFLFDVNYINIIVIQLYRSIPDPNLRKVLHIL